MSLKLMTILINVHVPRQIQELKQHIAAEQWEEAFKITETLRADIRDILKLINGTF